MNLLANSCRRLLAPSFAWRYVSHCNTHLITNQMGNTGGWPSLLDNERSTQHLVKLFIQLHPKAVLNIVLFGHAPEALLIHFKQLSW